VPTIRSCPRPITVSASAATDSRLPLVSLGLLVWLLAHDGIDRAAVFVARPGCAGAWHELVDLGYLTGSDDGGWLVHDEPRR
jgi:hypothetical protein